MTQEASIILDSISPDGHRLTSMALRYPKMIHGELMTHRVLSRNASSSRAIKTEVLLREVRDPEKRAMPVYYGKNKPGMQATEEMDDKERAKVEVILEDLAHYTADKVSELNSIGLHKQSANRYLEPFSHINVLVSATEYMNFFGLRLDKAAQPEMRALAEAMWSAYMNSTPQLLAAGMWHLPYLDEEDAAKIGLQERIMISVARCARVSYKSFETGKRSTAEEDLLLYQRLVGAQPIHASAAEHQATPDIEIAGCWQRPELHGNFQGWCQYRKTLEGENLAPLPEDYRKQVEEEVIDAHQ